MTREELVLQEAAIAAEQSGNIDVAYDAWRTLTSIDANRPDYFCKLGRVAERLGRWAYAEQAFLDAIKVASNLKAIPSTPESPELVDKTLSLAKTLLGSLFLKRTDGDRLANARKAKEWLEQAVAVDPNQASLSYLGSALARLGEKVAAKAAYRKVIELDETYVEAYINLGHLLSADGQAIEAEGLFRKAVQLDPCSHRAHGALGVLLEELGNYSEAEAELKRTLELNPNDPIARNRLRLLADEMNQE
ncbi:MAG: tetratricopeptide repeat protein [Acidobacteriaceae bacterium]|jgi:Flp pilus assembly protein TadD